jgi:hypothetical protein
MGERKWQERKQRVLEAQRKRQSVRTCAIHEAGHFVVTVVLGYPALAFIDTDTCLGGNYSVIPQTRQGTEDRIVAMVAGAVAEMMAGYGSAQPSLGDLAMALAASWMKTMLDRNIGVRSPATTAARLQDFYVAHFERVPNFVWAALKPLYTDAQHKAERILDQNWERVEQIAAMLIKHKEVRTTDCARVPGTRSVVAISEGEGETENLNTAEKANLEADLITTEELKALLTPPAEQEASKAS